VSRWVYPLVPEAPLITESKYTLQPGLTYKEPRVTVSRSARIGGGVVIGAGSRVGEGAVLERTVVGRDCELGDGAVVTDSHLWAGTPSCMML